jgi:hypothetical protein
LHRPREYFVYACGKLFDTVSFRTDNVKFAEKVAAWQSLDEMQIEDDVIQPINELIRRVLANFGHARLHRHLNKLYKITPDQIASTVDSLLILQMELSDLIPEMLRQDKKNDETIKGMSAFKSQGMIRALSSLEMTINMELNDFDLIEGKQSGVIHGITGTKYQHSSIKRDSINQSGLASSEIAGGFSTKPQVKTGFKLQLNLGVKK